MIELLALPFLACIILVIIHVYFGSFVINRGIIFIDIALAQWASLGYIVAYLNHYKEGIIPFLFGIIFTLIASLILSFLKPIYNKVNLQEAVIGVIYIGGAALTTGILSSSGLDGQHLKQMFAGQLLFLQSSEIIASLILYLIIGAILFKYHHQLSLCDTKSWNFAFYALFGCVVTSSVKMVGILLVFSYLVLPILSVILIRKKLKDKLLLGWLIGWAASFVGLIGSIGMDIPPTYCIILVLCVFWLISTGLNIRLIKLNKNE